MTRKHFEALAAAVRNARWKFYSPGDPDSYVYATLVLDYMANQLADVCAASNGSFDRERFLTACDIGSRVNP